MALTGKEEKLIMENKKSVKNAVKSIGGNFRMIDSSFVRTVIRGENIQVYYAPHAKDIEPLIATGCIPIEISIGQQNYVDDLKINHSNSLSHQPANCITSLKYYGVARSRKRSFLVSEMTLDSMMSAIILLGMIPKELCEKVAPIVAMEATDPFHPELHSMPYFTELCTWNNAMLLSNNNKAGNGMGSYGWLLGMTLWIDIITNPEPWADKFKQQEINEANRLKTANEDYDAGIIMDTGKTIVIPCSRVYGMDVNFQRIPENWNTQLSGWKHWCALVYIEKNRKITLACPNDDIAQALFGKDGLSNVYPLLPKLNAPENASESEAKAYYWGGKTSLGGSPKAGDATEEMLFKAGEIVDGLIKKAIGI